MKKKSLRSDGFYTGRGRKILTLDFSMCDVGEWKDHYKQRDEENKDKNIQNYFGIGVPI